MNKFHFYQTTLLFAFVFLFSLNTHAQERVMLLHLNNGQTHTYSTNQVDSVSFAKLEEVLPPIDAGTEMMSKDMQDLEKCKNYYTLTNQYIVDDYKNIVEYTFGASVAGQYALMPLSKDIMVKLYGGGKYYIQKYGCQNPEVLYDEQLNPLCSFSKVKNNINYSKNICSYTIDLTDKEGIFYLRRFVRLQYADKSSVKALEKFQPKGLTASIKNLNLPLAQFSKVGKAYSVPFSKVIGKVAFDFTINEDVNKSGNDLKIADIISHDKTQAICIHKEAPTQLKVKYSEDASSVNYADAQEFGFRSGFIFGTDTLRRTSDFYRPLAGETALIIWLKGIEYQDEPTAQQLIEHSESLVPFLNYYLAILENKLLLLDNTTEIASVTLEGKTIQQVCDELQASPTFDNFIVSVMGDNGNKPATELMNFDKIKLVGNYYQSFDISNESFISQFDYHYDSYPVPLRLAIDKTKHTFEAIASNDGIYAGIDGNFAFLDYELLKQVQIYEDGITIFNIDYRDGDLGDFHHIFSSTTRMSSPYVTTERSPYLLGLMGHHVNANTAEGHAANPNSDTSSGRLEKLCAVLDTTQYNTMNMEELVTFMDNGMKNGMHSFFMFDDFQFKDIYETVSTRNIFISHNIKTNLALIHSYLNKSYNAKYKAMIEPMKALGWSCVSHSLRHNMPTAKKPSVAFDYECRAMRDECVKQGMNPDVFVYNWNGTWEVSDILLQKNGYKYAINSSGINTTRSTNPYRIGRTSFNDGRSFSDILKFIKWN